MLASRLKQFYFAHFSKPASHRVLYRTIDEQRCCRFLEIGVGRGERAGRMLELAGRHHPKEAMFYVGIDLFEARPSGSQGLSLKEAHRLFKGYGVKAQLLPGDPYNTLARAANALRDVDLVLVSPGQDAAQLAQAWFYLPRILHQSAAIFVEVALADGETRLDRLSHEEIAQRARRPRRRAA